MPPAPSFSLLSTVPRYRGPQLVEPFTRGRTLELLPYLAITNKAAMSISKRIFGSTCIFLPWDKCPQVQLLGGMECASSVKKLLECFPEWKLPTF